MAVEAKNKQAKGENSEKVCFVIMPFSDHEKYPEGHFAKVYEQIFKVAIENAGFKPKRVDEDKISADILAKIFDGVQNAEMALCDLSSRNPNVLYELGLRHAYGKPVVLTCDDKTERIFDVSGINTVPYCSSRLYEDVIFARQELEKAIRETYNSNSSIVKIAKAQVASAIIDDNLESDEVTNLMLNSIMQELKEIKTASKHSSVTNERIDRNTNANVFNKLLNKLDRIEFLSKDKNLSTDKIEDMLKEYKEDFILHSKILYDDQYNILITLFKKLCNNIYK